MLTKVLTGGRGGAEQAAWRAAKACGLAVGGWMPEGFPTEDGPRPEFAELYGSLELPIDNGTAPTEHNIQESDATLWFGETTTEEAQDGVGESGVPGRSTARRERSRGNYFTTWDSEDRLDRN
jgi:Circularly permutated YpsA SLOG family